MRRPIINERAIKGCSGNAATAIAKDIGEFRAIVVMVRLTLSS